MSCLMGIDIGTSGTRTLLIDEAGKLVASATAEHPLSLPAPGWAEQNPADWVATTIETVRRVLAETGIPGAQIKGVGLSGQMHGSVFLDAKDEVIRPAILWCDQRTFKQCEWITSKVGRETLKAEICNPVLTGFTAPKIIWLRDNEPANFERLRKVLLPKDYIRLVMTGEYVTEVSDASGMALLNVPERRWSDVVIEKIGLSKDMLATVVESPEVTGRVSARFAEATGLTEGTPVVGGGGDQAAGAVGNGIVEAGVISSTVGTSGVVFAHLEELAMDDEMRTHTFCHAVPGKWHVMGVMLAAGGSLQWYRNKLCSDEMAVASLWGNEPYVLIVSEAAEAPVGSEGLIFLPYLSGERTPYPNPNARGVFCGLSLRHDKRHLARAVMEGVSYGLRDSFEIIESMGVDITQVRASGGGARSEYWVQMQADVTGRPHSYINVDEGPAFGVALLAGVGTGVWKSVPEACRAAIQVERTLDPNPENLAFYNRGYLVYQSLYQKLEDSFDELAELVELAPTPE
ncbi:MAG: xylulokinase [Armatimonadetes bacterium]|nr:xylulokinase [Armatimonadota bacterium]